MGTGKAGLYTSIFPPRHRSEECYILVGGYGSCMPGAWFLRSTLGIGLFEVDEFFASEAEESCHGRFGGRDDVAEDGMPSARIVGEAVCVLGYLDQWGM
jgi:hypothetical protein